MFRFSKVCKHEYRLIAGIGGGVQAYAYQCENCGRKKVEISGESKRISYEYIMNHGRHYETYSTVENVDQIK